MHYKEGKNRNELLMFPQMDFWVSKDNIVRLIDLVVDKVVMSNPDKFKWKGKEQIGRKSYSPNTMLKLLLYSYLNSLSGSRKIEGETYRNIELMWLIQDLHPDHWTICEYRRDNSEQIKYITIEFRKFLKSENYIDGKVQATDGSKFKAYASRDMLTVKKIEKRLENIDKKLEEYLEEFKRVDTLEDLKEEIKEGFTDRNGPDINMVLIDKIADLQAQIEKLKKQKEQIENSSKKYLAPNDPDANMMKSRDGYIAGYNGQIIVDNKNKLITLSEITTHANDKKELKNNVETQKEQIDLEPEILEADTGYDNLKQIQEIEKNTKTECFIPIGQSKTAKKDKKNEIEFTYNKERNEYTCTQGKTLKLHTRNKKYGDNKYDIYKCRECQGCPIRTKCTTSKTGRMIRRSKNQEWIDDYKAKMKLNGSKEKIKERKTIVEHPFGTIKRWMGKFNFLLTGKHKVQIEFNLYALVYNIKRMEKIENMAVLLQKVENYSW